MADWQIRKTNLEMNLGTATAISTQFQELNSRTAVHSSDKSKLNGKMQSIEAQTADIQHAIETYEKEFLDRKNGAPITYPMFTTLQDYVLLLFFIGYFLVAFALVFSVFRTAGRMAAVVGVIGTIVFSVVLAEAIRRFG
jgi:hypothetical protein